MIPDARFYAIEIAWDHDRRFEAIRNPPRMVFEVREHLIITIFEIDDHMVVVI